MYSPLLVKQLSGHYLIVILYINFCNIALMVNYLLGDTFTDSVDQLNLLKQGYSPYCFLTYYILSVCPNTDIISFLKVA